MEQKKQLYKKISVIFITTDGIQHLCGGVGHYTSNFIKVLYELRDKIKEYGIDLSLYACEPALLRILPTYSKAHYDEMKKIIESSGGKFYKLVNNTSGEDWISHVENWKILSASAATIALNVAIHYDNTIVFFGSSCLAMTQVYIHKQKRAFGVSISTVYLTHDSAFSAFYKEKNENVLSMDFICSQWTNFEKNAKIGYVSEYMKELFKNTYRVKEENLIECRGGIMIESQRFQKLEKSRIESLLDEYGIPKDKKIVFGWGRPEKYKRYDLIYQSCNETDELFPVVVTNGEMNSLRKYIDNYNMRGIFIENYRDFELINALVSWNNTLCCCFFSDREPGAITPIEAMYMANNHKSVVLVNEEGHMGSLVTDGVTGFKCRNELSEIVDKYKEILGKNEEELKAVNKKAYMNAINNYSQFNKYVESICSCIPELEIHKHELLRKYI